MDTYVNNNNTKLLAHLVIWLEENLVVLWEGDQEDNGRYVLEAVDPLTPLRPLTAHVHHPVTRDDR